MPTRDDRHRVLIAGGGVAALEAMVALRKLAGELVEVTLLSPDLDFFYRPMAVAEPFGVGTMQRFDLPSLARGCGAAHVLGALLAVSPQERVVRTSRGSTHSYDTLLIAIGARQREAVPGALSFRGGLDSGRLSNLLSDLDRGLVGRVVFALPGGVTWPLPLYELALLTADHLRHAGESSAELTIVTPEEAPLGLLDGEASAAVAALLEEREIELLTGKYPERFEQGELHLVPKESIPADAVVSVPTLRGVPLAGVPQDENCFVEVDTGCRVPGLDGVFAAGDITTFPIKQGGLAAQQADAAAAAIAARAGASVAAQPFEPVLRGLLLGDSPLYLRTELGGGHGAASTAADEALWWPAAKIAARYLGPYLAEHIGLAQAPRGSASVF